MSKAKGTARIATGLHLWEVEIRYQSGPGKGGVSLWITTPAKKLHRAIEKAERFLFRSELYVSAEIQGIKYRGTIDA